MFSVHDASQGAGQTRPVNSGKLLVLCRLREASCQSDAIDQVVPVGDLVVHRTAVVAIGNAAIHAARRLIARRLLRQRQNEFPVMANAVGRGRIAPVRAVDFEKTCHLAHSVVPSPSPVVGEGRGGGLEASLPSPNSQAPAARGDPLPNPPPQGGGDFSARDINSISFRRMVDPAKRGYANLAPQI